MKAAKMKEELLKLSNSSFIFAALFFLPCAQLNLRGVAGSARFIFYLFVVALAVLE